MNTLTLTLTHYADTQVTLDRGREYKQLPPESFTYKPQGLWVSVDGEDDWPSWCTDAGYFLDGLEYAYRVVLAAEANIVWIDTPQKFVEFHSTYAVPEKRSRMWETMTDETIDWPTVACKYDGIVIAPYLWSFRLSCMWYYGWDCASGCIWNLDAIAEFTLIPGDTRRFRNLIDDEEISS